MLFFRSVCLVVAVIMVGKAVARPVADAAVACHNNDSEVVADVRHLLYREVTHPDAGKARKDAAEACEKASNAWKWAKARKGISPTDHKSAQETEEAWAEDMRLHNKLAHDHDHHIGDPIESHSQAHASIDNAQESIRAAYALRPRQPPRRARRA